MEKIMTAMSKMLFVIDELEIGGAQNQILLLGRVMHKMGYSVSVAYFREKGAVLIPQLHEAGLSTLPFNKNQRVDFAFLSRLIKYFRRNRDVRILSFGYTANFWTRMALLAVKGPKVVTCIRDHKYIPAFLPKPIEQMLIWLERLLTWKSLLIVANSSVAMESLVARGVIPRSKCIVIPNGVEGQNFVCRAEAKANLERLLSPGTGPIIGCMARLVQVKDHVTLVRAARIVVDAVPDARFLIAGEGPERRNIEQLCANLQLDKNVFLPGSLPGALYLAGLDVAALQSQDEGMPNFILEAMATEIPVIASSVGALPELLEGGRLGTLFSVGDYKTMAEGIISIIKAPADARKKAADAQAKARSMRPVDIAKQYVSLF